MIKVYIASPYTLGDTAVNVKKQIDTANALIKMGYAPYAPLLCHFQHLIHPQDYEVWTIQTMEWLKCCDVVLRLSGRSAGADNEVMMAKKLEIPVVVSIDDLLSTLIVERRK